MRGKKILMLSRNDNCGSGYGIVEAVSLHSNHFVEYMVLMDELSGFVSLKTPYILRKIKNSRNEYEIEKNAFNCVQKIIDNVDIIHIKGDELPSDKFYQFNLPKDKPRIITVAGSRFRRGKSEVAMPKFKISEYVELTDFRSAITPDLNYPEFKAEYIPHTIDIEKIDYSWKENKIPIIAHCKAMNNKKHTEEFIKAMNILKDEGYKFHLDIIEKVTHSESMKRKSNATIFYDEMSGCGWFGLSGIESMALGIPTVSYLSEEALKQGNIKNIPIVNCGNTVESLTNTFRKLLKSSLIEISEKTREYAIKNYSYEVIGKRWAEIYNAM